MVDWRNGFSHDCDPARFDEAMEKFAHHYRESMEALYAFLRDR